MVDKRRYTSIACDTDLEKVDNSEKRPNWEEPQIEHETLPHQDEADAPQERQPTQENLQEEIAPNQHAVPQHLRRSERQHKPPERYGQGTY